MWIDNKIKFNTKLETSVYNCSSNIKVTYYNLHDLASPVSLVNNIC